MRLLIIIFRGLLLGFGLIFRVLNYKTITLFFIEIIRAIANARSSEESLRFLLELEQKLFNLTGREATRYGNGIHPKHRHIGYHDFFCDRLSPGERVIDIGCGNGFLAYDMATRSGAIVTAIDLSQDNFQKAVKQFSHPRIRFIHGDVLHALPDDSFDTAVMSNVLEHFTDRIKFLISVQKYLNLKRWLIRIPMFERDWRVPLMAELGVDFRLDNTHHFEPTVVEFVKELEQAGLTITHREICWGEIRCEAKPRI